jgi:hypothetical protein
MALRLMGKMPMLRQTGFSNTLEEPRRVCTKMGGTVAKLKNARGYLLI